MLNTKPRAAHVYVRVTATQRDTEGEVCVLVTTKQYSVTQTTQTTKHSFFSLKAEMEFDGCLASFLFHSWKTGRGAH